jgi:hypothetical protein
MPVERRLREGMQRNADALNSDVDRLLAEVVRKSRRRVMVRRAAIVVTAATALFLAIAVGPRALDALRNAQERVPATKPTPTVSGVQALTGSFTRRLTESSPAVRVNQMAGEWTIDLHADGTMGVTAPPAFTGVLSVVQFQVTGDRFRTNFHLPNGCTNLPLGTYRWSRSGPTLTFTVIDDACQARVTLFASEVWTSTS